MDVLCENALHLHIQRTAFTYFECETDRETGLVLDRNQPGWPASIAATGLALACYPIAVERSLMTRHTALARSLATLRFFGHSPQGEQPDATGYRGFYYHFLHADSGKRAWQCEISSVDTAFLIAGMLAAAAYFQGDDAQERELRELAEMLYRRVEWDWLLDDSGRIRHGWRPEKGFIPFRWEGYDESLVMQVLALASPTHPASASSYDAWSSTFAWKNAYDIDYLYSAPLFTHQLSHVWLDLRGIQDRFMRSHGIDYFENSRRATHVQHRYAIDNPMGFRGYGEHGWGITASDGPGPITRIVDGVERTFYDYISRGAPFGVDDGTLAPWAVAASLPFAPDLVEAAMHSYVHKLKLHDIHRYGFRATFNPTFGNPECAFGWISPWHYGLNIGPIVAMIENHHTGMLWKLMRGVPWIVDGLRKAGFSGGWLEAAHRTDP
ncbi:glucoamylase family protein [Dyella jejuensis]|uniref:glucoamylase family protein n=1 Tax=Dyella jejuensis TaxID=1432009 RepID=UPI00385087CA